MPQGASVVSNNPATNEPLTDKDIELAQNNGEDRVGKRPVILIHGTWMNAYNTFGYIAPHLAANGFQAYTFNYGQESDSLCGKAPSVRGLADMDLSYEQVKAGIDEVRRVTGAKKVDLIGHSQGAIYPRLYAQDHPGAVGTIISMGGNHHGATLSGTASVLDKVPAIEKVMEGILGTAPIQQTPGRPMFSRLNDQGEVVVGVNYLNICTRFDWAATPWRNGFLDDSVPHARVVNLGIQDQVPGDWSEHVALLYSPNVLFYLMRALRGEWELIPPDETVRVLPFLGSFSLPGRENKNKGH